MADRTNPDRKPDTKRKKNSDVPKQEEEIPIFNPEESPLVAHARRELDLAGINASDSDYGGALAKAAEELVTTFAAQRHSGASAEITIELFSRLAKFEALTPLTTDPKEWESISEMAGYPLWQNKRAPANFSKDGGKTWYNVETNDKGRSLTLREVEDAKKKAAEQQKAA